MGLATRLKTAQITLNPEGQDSDAITGIVAGILRRAGCLGCGRLVRLDAEFAADPGPEFEDFGAISVRTAEF